MPSVARIAVFALVHLVVYLAAALPAVSQSPSEPAAGDAGTEAEADAPSWSVDADGSLFAVVTHKEGLAKGLAHEHFIVATSYDASLVFDRQDERAASFLFEAAVEDLAVDDAELAAAWQDGLLERELIAEPFSELSDKDRRKIRKSMLADDQLDAESHPTISARLHDPEPAEEGTYLGTLELTVNGRTASRELRFELFEDGAELKAEATCGFRFSDFGIEPYSAMLGAIKVADSFDVFVRVVARR